MTPKLLIGGNFLKTQCRTKDSSVDNSNPTMTDNFKNLKREVLIREAGFWIGSRERGGENQGEIIELFQKLIGGAQGEPWCMGFAQFCVNKVDLLIGNSGYSKLALSENCVTVWAKTPMECRLEKPEPGSIAIWQFGETSSGHCGVVEKILDEGSFHSIEGNTKGLDVIVREGDGVFRRTRTIASSHRFKLLGFLNPWP
jgi:hypothetical protein